MPARTIVISVTRFNPPFSINAAHNTQANKATIDAGVEMDNNTSELQL